MTVRRSTVFLAVLALSVSLAAQEKLTLADALRVIQSK